MEKFTASNGVEITVSDTGLIGWSARRAHHDAALALFEFYEHKSEMPRMDRARRVWHGERRSYKPWHEAKHNEIWVLFVAICDEAYRVDGDAFVPVNSPGRVRIPLTDDRIQSARRIFPEVSDE